MNVDSLHLNHISNIMKYITLCLSIFLFSFVADAQIGSEKEAFEFFEVEHPAKYIGGEEQLHKFISENLNYPSDAMECDCQGKVFVEFIIRKNGEVDNVAITRSLLNCGGPPKLTKKEEKAGVEPLDCEEVKQAMEKESIRVVSAMPDWEPAIVRGKPVNTRFRLPLMFKLY